MSEPSATQRAVAHAWLQAQGLPEDFVTDVHPDDEMMGTLADYGVDDSHRLFEYFRSGQEALSVVENVLSAVGRSWSDVGRFLEFACGFGRFTRHLVRKLPPERIWSSDILKDGVKFVRETFGVHGFDSATDPGACPLPTDLDVIWVGSLFSHLPRPRFEAWLTRLAASLSETGLLIFTTHGEDVVPEVPKEASGFTFAPQSESLSLDKSEYGATFVRPDIVREIAGSCGLTSLHHLEREIWWIQDVFVASRREVALPSWRPAPFVKGTFDHIRFASGQGWLGGWVVVPDSTELAKIEVIFNGQLGFPAELSPPTRGDEVDRIRPNASHIGWVVHGSSDPLPEGHHLAAAVATLTTGERFCFDVRPFAFNRGQESEWQLA